MTIRRLSELPRICFEGNIPAMLATVGPDGLPNATWLSQVYFVDDRHVALSCQFFRKTQQNLESDPRAQLMLVNPEHAEQWRLDLRFERREVSGAVFEQLKRRIEMIAKLTGTEGVFELRSADVFEVMMITPVETRAPERSAPEEPSRNRVDPLLALSRITEGVAGCRDLGSLVETGLSLLTLHLGLETVSLFLAEESERMLYALATSGYPSSGVGARLDYGVGIVGLCAQQRMALRITDMPRELRYVRAVQEQRARVMGEPERDVPLPGLPNAVGMLAVPLVLDGELFGVLSTETARFFGYDERDVMLLQTAGQVLAQAIARHREDESEREPERAMQGDARNGVLKVRYYEADDSIFLDGEYLIKGLPGRILWLLLTIREREGRESFSNRELRLHPLLKLPSYKDNLETRLLMLQRRLEDKGSALRLSRAQRGRLGITCELGVSLEQS